MKRSIFLSVCAALFGFINAQVPPMNRVGVPGVGGVPGQVGFNQFGTPGFNQFGTTGLNQFGTLGFNNPGVNQFGFGGINQFPNTLGVNQFGVNQFGTTGLNTLGFNNPSLVPGGQVGGFAGANIPAQFGQFNQFGNRFGQIPGQFGQIPGQFGQVPGQFGVPGQINRFNTPVGKK